MPVRLGPRRTIERRVKSAPFSFLLLVFCFQFFPNSIVIYSDSS